MTRSKWFLSIGLVALLLAGGAMLAKRVTAPKPLPAEAAAALEAEAPRTRVAAKEPVPAAVEAFRRAVPVARVQAFYAAESKRIGQVDPDPKLTELRLRLIAEELNVEEIAWLKDTALDRKAEGDGRFFAAYMLALSPPATEALRVIATSAVPKSKNQGLVELERQVRAQAVEGLGRQCGNEAAKDGLIDTVARQEDEFLRDRAHRSAFAWEKCRPVAGADRKAAAELLYGK